MKKKFFTVKIEHPIDEIWQIINSYETLFPLLPGYLRHEKINEKESIWTVKRDLGLIKKKIDLKVCIKEWDEPNSIRFTLQDSKERFTGNCSVETKMITDNHTLITGHFQYIAGGSINKFLTGMIKKDESDIREEIKKFVKAKL